MFFKKKKKNTVPVMEQEAEEKETIYQGVATEVFKTTYRDVAVDVLVLGVRGAGKTSLLATMLYDGNGLLKKKGLEFKAADRGTQTRLDKTIDEMKAMVQSGGELEIGEGLEGTEGLPDFNFQLKFVDGSWGETPDFHITFHDYQGGILTDGAQNKDYRKLEENFLKSQIVYILVDTPYLMNGDERLKKAYLAQDEIRKLFRDRGEESGDKLIAFVPTKCEFYLRRNEIDGVKARIEEEFRDLFEEIHRLNEKKKKYYVYFTPVKTIGGVEFTKIKTRGDEQVAGFRRTEPGSLFEPENTDLLLLFCLKYLFGIFFKQMAAQIKPKQMDKIKQEIEEIDKGKGKFNSDITKYNQCKDSEQRQEVFGQLLRKFFSEYSDCDTILQKMFENYKETGKCYIVDIGEKKLEENFETMFRKYFIEF